MIAEIFIKNFRNLSRAELSFSSSLNLIFGENGSGKTSLLEAIYLCGFGRSFKGSNQIFTKIGEDFAKIFGKNEERNEIEIIFTKDGEKKIVFNGKRIIKISGLLGHFPMTYIGPGEVMAVAGSPSVRRTLIDSHICQFDSEFTSTLLAYKHSVRQRNAALRGVANNEIAGGTVLIDAWDEKVANLGAKVIEYRIDFLKKLSPLASNIFNAIAGNGAGELFLKYRCTVAKNPQIDDLEGLFFARLREMRDYHLQRFETTIGPHRDDVEIFLKNFPAKQFASWGQVRMISLALYLGAAKILSEHTQPVPTIMLDDALAELDPKRARAALEIVPEIGQTIVATPHPEQIKNFAEAKVFTFVEPGNIIENNEKS